MRSTIGIPNPAAGQRPRVTAQAHVLDGNRGRIRCELRLIRWTPESVGFEVRLQGDDLCAQLSSYVLKLVDDRDMQFPWHPLDWYEERDDNNHVARVERRVRGEFPAPIGPRTEFISVRLLPNAGAHCPAQEFRWKLLPPEW